MKDKSITVPVGMQVLGRVLNASGKPIDQKGAITGAQHVPLYNAVSKDQTVPGQLFETGIKVIDLLAPIPRGGIVGMFAGPGLGKQVVLEELVHNVATRRAGYMVGLGMDASTYEVSELMEPVREGELESKTVLLFEQLTDSLEVVQQLVWTGLTIAGHLVEQGHDVLLVADKNVARKRNAAILQKLRSAAQAKGITTILLGSPDDFLRGDESALLTDFDSRILFSSELPEQQLWPAIDRLTANNSLLESGVLSAEHVQAARQVQQLLRRYPQLTGQAENIEPSQEDQHMMARAQRIQLFLTQPFFVAEAYTDVPGEYVKVEDTVRGCQELLEGRYDNLPEQAFWFVGTIEQALAKGKSM